MTPERWQRIKSLFERALEPSRGRSVALTRGDSRLAIAIAVVRQSLSPFDLHLI